jgi:hypothetical protein
MPDEKLVRLIAVASREGFSFDDTRYEIAADGTVDVPSRAVPWLTHAGAFEVAPTQPDDEATLNDEALAALSADPEI